MKRYCFHYLTAILTSLFLVSCAQEGPAEKAGKKVDDAVEEVQDTFHETKDEVYDTLQDEDEDKKEKSNN